MGLILLPKSGPLGSIWLNGFDSEDGHPNRLCIQCLSQQR